MCNRGENDKYEQLCHNYLHIDYKYDKWMFCGIAWICSKQSYFVSASGYFLQIAPCDSFQSVNFHHVTQPHHRRPVMTRSVCSLVLRGALLFVVGVFFTFVLNLLQIQRRVPVIPDVFESLFASAWWIAPICGTAAGMCSNVLSWVCKIVRESSPWNSMMYANGAIQNCQIINAVSRYALQM